MADKNDSTATGADSAGASPNAEAGAQPANTQANGASSPQDLRSFLAGIGVTMAGDEAPLEPPAPKGEAATKPETETAAETDTQTDTDTTTEDDAEATETTADDESAAKPEAETETLTVTDDGKVKLGRNELAMIDKLKSAKVGEAEVSRFVDALKREKKARLLRDDAERRATEAQKRLTQMETQLAEQAEKSTVLPSGPLANLQDAKELDAAEQNVLRDLQHAEDDPEGYVARFRDTETGTAEENAARWKRRCLALIPEFKHQRQHIEARTTTREALRKQAPALFSPTSDEGKQRLSLYANDPRLNPDFDQWIADAVRGRKAREDESGGKFKYVRVDLDAARANGALGAKTKTAANGANGTHSNGNGHGNGKAQPTKQVTLPPPRQSLPAMPAGTNRLQELRARSARGESVSMDEMIAAQMGQ